MFLTRSRFTVVLVCSLIGHVDSYDWSLVDWVWFTVVKNTAGLQGFLFIFILNNKWLVDVSRGMKKEDILLEMKNVS